MTPLERLARRASADPSFLGHALRRYAARHGLTDALLAQHLRCTPDALARLRLCGLPRPGREAEDVAGVAAAVGCDAGRLAGVLDM